MKMYSKFVSCILLVSVLLCSSLFCCTSSAEESSRYEQAVPFGVAHSVDGSGISLYKKPGSKTSYGTLSDYTLCSVLSVEKLSGSTWFHISYIDDVQREQDAYVKDGDFYQLTVSGLISITSDPDTAAYLQMFSGVAGSSAFVSYAASVSRTVPSQPEPTDSPAPEPEEEKTTYILNKNTKKFHDPSCPGADDIKPKNRIEFYGTREEIIQNGYKPCKSCKP